MAVELKPFHSSKTNQDFMLVKNDNSLTLHMFNSDRSSSLVTDKTYIDNFIRRNTYDKETGARTSFSKVPRSSIAYNNVDNISI